MRAFSFSQFFHKTFRCRVQSWQAIFLKNAIAFRDLYAHVEHALRRNDYTRKDRKRAGIDWIQFAKDMGESFFDYVRTSQKAETLVSEPPRVFHRGRGMQPKTQTPIADIIQLFLRGGCQVRNNIEHGEKYIDGGGVRDNALVSEAPWFLEQAIKRHPHTNKIFPTLQLTQ
jgi:hypothetical protein